MLLEQTVEKLSAMKLNAMLQTLQRCLNGSQERALTTEEILGMAVDAEWTAREDRKMQSRLRHAQLRQPACVEAIDYKRARGLDKTLMLELTSSRWVKNNQNVILTGKTGVGKSYIACALSHKACRDGYTAIYRRVPRLFDELANARADGSYAALTRRFAKADVLVLDDFGTHTLTAADRKELLELLEDRYGRASTVVTSQVDAGDWHAVIGDQTVADSICDRVVHNAYRMRLTGESIRKVKGQELTAQNNPAN